MVRLRVAAIALSLIAWAAHADEKPNAVATPNATAALTRQVANLEIEFDKEFRSVVAEFRTAQGDERARVREKALKMAPEYAARMMALADANPKDPAAVKALIWIANVSSAKNIPPPPQAREALNRIVKDHLDHPEIGEICSLLVSRPDGEKLLRQIREKNASKAVRVLAAFSLASMLSDDERRPTPAQLAEAEKLLAHAVAEARAVKNFPGDRFREAESSLFELRNLTIGKSAPELESVDLDGRKVRLSDYKGKVVVLDIWTTWCSPCLAMIPHERELVKKFEGKPFALISVNADAEKDELTRFLEKEKMPWVHWWAGARNGVLEKWNVKFFPTIYVIDSKGVIRYKHVREKEMDEAVETLLKEMDAPK